MLTDLFEIGERILLSPHNSRHPTESSTFELFAAVERVAEFQETDIVFCDLVDEVTSSAELAEGEFVVVFVVEDVHEGGEEGV